MSLIKNLSTSLGIILLFSTAINAQQSSVVEHNNIELQSNASSLYNPSLGRLGLQFGSGVLFGAGGGIVAGLSAGLAAPEKKGFDLTGLEYAFTGFYIGYTAVSALGVYMVANSSTYDASFGSILLGHGIGAGAGIGSMVLMDSVDGQAGIAIIFALASPIIGGMIANNSSITKRTKTSALLNISPGNTTLSTPAVQIEQVGNPDFMNKPKNEAYSPTVKLVNISL